MNKILTLLLALVCLKVFPQCGSQTVVPDSAFDGKLLASSGSCFTYHLNKPLVTGQAYSITLDLTGYPNSCGSATPPVNAQCQIYLGWDSCDMTGQSLTANNGGIPFPDTLMRFTFPIHPSQSFTYISLVYSFNAGMGWAGCPSGLTIDSFILTSSATPLAVSVQLNNNSCPSDSNGKATVHATGYSPFTYQWSNGQTNSTLQHVPAGTYGVTVRDSTGCLAHDTVVVGTQSPTTATVGLLPNDTLKSSPASSYQWYLNGSAISGATGQKYVALQNGNYDVIVIDSTGCTSNASTAVYIGDVSGISDISNANIRLYPNPAISSVNIVSDGSHMILKLSDLAGREIFSKEFIGTVNNMDVSQIAKGVYLARIQQGGNLLCERLIIQ